MCRYGTILINTCKSYKNADPEIMESTLLIETRWYKIQTQLELLRSIWPTLDEDYQIHQNSVLQVLQGKIQTASSLVDSVIGNPDDESSVRSIKSKKGETRRAKYAVWVKGRLNSVVDDLKEWSEVFDVSWYLIIRLSNKDIDKELQPVRTGEKEPLSTLKDLREAIKSNLSSEGEVEKSTVFLPAGFFSQVRIPFLQSSSEIWEASKDKSRYLVDELSTISTLPDVCKLAKILQKVEPFQFGILSCKGVLKSLEDPATGSRFAFSIPNNLHEPQYLRTLILSDIRSRSLDVRFSLAKQLAKAVMFVHSGGFVHKNIRPETILVFRDSTSTLPWAFLTGFESFRLAEGKTQHQGDDKWEKNLYRHPDRQGIRPEEDYVMQHDIYSLGVCLLEIGIGDSLILWNAEGSESYPSQFLANAVAWTSKDQRKKAFEVKRALVKGAEEELPPKMGARYTEIVVTCLTCLDKQNNGFGHQNEFLDENGILVGVRFIERILTTLLDLKI